VSEGLRVVAWMKDDPPGMELAEVRLAEGLLAACGVAIGSDPAPYRLDYSLVAHKDFVTTGLRVESQGGGLRNALDLWRSDQGRWNVNGEERPDLDDALDCDLGLSPLTNSMPVLRHGLLQEPASFDLLTAWISVPDLEVHASRQRYSGLGGGRVRFESLDDSFTAEIAFDENGLVVDYPGIGRRLTRSSGG
jgi:hypothetical protein